MMKYLFFMQAVAITLAVSLTTTTVTYAEDVFEKLFPYEYGEFEGDFEGNKWKEEQLTLPEFPNDDDLLEFTGPPGYSQYRYSIDGKSLKVGSKDGVVRYILVIASKSGSKNVYYQGLSCKKQQLKQYAYGDSSNSKLIASKLPKWEALSQRGAMGYSDNLASFYFCNHMGQVLTRDGIIHKLKYGQGEQDSEYF